MPTARTSEGAIRWIGRLKAKRTRRACRLRRKPILTEPWLYTLSHPYQAHTRVVPILPRPVLFLASASGWTPAPASRFTPTPPVETHLVSSLDFHPVSCHTTLFILPAALVPFARGVILRSCSTTRSFSKLTPSLVHFSDCRSAFDRSARDLLPSLFHSRHSLLIALAAFDPSDPDTPTQPTLVNMIRTLILLVAALAAIALAAPAPKPHYGVSGKASDGSRNFKSFSRGRHSKGHTRNPRTELMRVYNKYHWSITLAPLDESGSWLFDWPSSSSSGGESDPYGSSPSEPIETASAASPYGYETAAPVAPSAVMSSVGFETRTSASFAASATASISGGDGGDDSGEVTASPEENESEYLSPVSIAGQKLNLNFDTGSADL